MGKDTRKLILYLAILTFTGFMVYLVSPKCLWILCILLLVEDE